ncbi:hypothetical protein U91I_00431 [alpha proteobacterium U9-1i]|nr:hypothetical protein U91I_00431 [alpha proteobacterium U9-1i]
MSDSAPKPKPPRRANGTFEKGASGNPNGRPKGARPPDILSPQNVRDTIYDAADFEVPIVLQGKRKKLTLFEANLLTLAMAGAGGDKASAAKFVDAIARASDQELRMMDATKKRIDGYSPAYRLETDPAKREELRKAWMRLLREAEGDRERTTRGIQKRRKKPDPWD